MFEAVSLCHNNQPQQKFCCGCISGCVQVELPRFEGGEVYGGTRPQQVLINRVSTSVRQLRCGFGRVRVN
jgi:hypothetical protein